MIQEQKFPNLSSLNKFVDEEKVNVVNVETYIYEYDTGFPLPRGGSFKVQKEGKRLFYTKIPNK